MAMNRGISEASVVNGREHRSEPDFEDSQPMFSREGGAGAADIA